MKLQPAPFYDPFDLAVIIAGSAVTAALIATTTAPNEGSQS